MGAVMEMSGGSSRRSVNDMSFTDCSPVYVYVCVDACSDRDRERKGKAPKCRSHFRLPLFVSLFLCAFVSARLCVCVSDACSNSTNVRSSMFAFEKQKTRTPRESGIRTEGESDGTREREGEIERSERV